MRNRIGLVGYGKIAADQHIPAIAASADFELAAIASGSRRDIDGIPVVYPTLEAMMAGEPRLDSVAICTPPGPRPALVHEAVRAGRHVLLEKPLAATMREAEALVKLTGDGGPTLFATWHSRFNKAVEETRRRLASEPVKQLRVTWKEDVRQWHPGQDWVWEPGGFGVFDPGINALSILTHILPDVLSVAEARIEVPANRQTPIAAFLTMAMASSDARIEAEFDWRQTGPQRWDVEIWTEAGDELVLSRGGSALSANGRIVVDETPREYEAIYTRFATLIREGRSEMDLSPLRLATEAVMIGRRVDTDRFDW